ncbi:preprotein translocase subunit SecE [Brachybacterium huguangmaarense]
MSSSQQATASRSPEGADDRGAGRNPITAIVAFVREVVAELRKVVVPTRGEMASYTVTVLAFVFVMILIVFGLDFAFGWLARFTFTTSGA